MIPQYVFSYRENAKTKQNGPLVFICLFGLYRCFYALHWIYKLNHVESGTYSDYTSWIAGGIEIAFFFDFLAFQFFGGVSLLKHLVMVIDDAVNGTVEII